MHTVMRVARLCAFRCCCFWCIVLQCVLQTRYILCVFEHIYSKNCRETVLACARGKTACEVERFPAKVIKQKNKSIYDTFLFGIFTLDDFAYGSGFKSVRLFISIGFFFTSQDDLMTQKNETSREKITNIIAC